MQRLCGYFNCTWIDGSYRPETWSSYFLEIRTNNDVEGWHSSLNSGLDRSANFYGVVDHLHKKAETLTVQEKCLKAGQSLREAKYECQEREEKIWDLWTAYNIKEIDIEMLHSEIVNILIK